MKLAIGKILFMSKMHEESAVNSDPREFRRQRRSRALGARWCETNGRSRMIKSCEKSNTTTKFSSGKWFFPIFVFELIYLMGLRYIASVLYAFLHSTCPSSRTVTGVAAPFNNCGVRPGVGEALNPGFVTKPTNLL